MKKEKKADRQKTHTKKNGAEILRTAAEIVIPAGMTALSVYLYGIVAAEQIRIGVLVGLLLLLVQFARARSRIADDYLYDNRWNQNRFLAAYLVLFGASCLFPLFTQMGWPFLSIAVVLTLFSNALVGMAAFTSLLTVSALIGGVSMQVFLMYFICGICAAVLFSSLDESFRVELPMILSCMVYGTSMCANVIITRNANLSYEMFIIPVISLFLNVVLILMLLWYTNTRIAGRIKGRYMEINDPEYELMQKIKKTGMQYYYHAIHTAYLCNKIAVRLQMNADAVRAAGFYHEAGVIHHAADPKNSLLTVVRDEYRFPQEVCDILEEYTEGGPVKNKETAVLMMSAAVIESIMKKFEKDKDAKINYKELIELLFQNKMDKGSFQRCNITMEEMGLMKKILMEENLYYDFLR